MLLQGTLGGDFDIFAASGESTACVLHSNFDVFFFYLSSSLPVRSKKSSKSNLLEKTIGFPLTIDHLVHFP